MKNILYIYSRTSNGSSLRDSIFLVGDLDLFTTVFAVIVDFGEQRDDEIAVLVDRAAGSSNAVLEEEGPSKWDESF